jgi:hypothetical protein
LAETTRATATSATDGSVSARGIVRRVHRRGFGFAESDILPGEPIFFPAYAVRRECGVRFDEIQPGDVISFDLAWSADGRPQATEVLVLRAFARADLVSD